MNEMLETGRIIGAYRIIRPLGSGGMGAVYEVEHLKLKKRRALKIFAVEGENVALHRKRFLSEGKMLAALNNPRVVRVHEFDVDAASGRPYFVMDLVLSPSGTPHTLEDERTAGMDEARAASYFRDICEGLDYVHSLGIVHRDIKLENILIDLDGRAVLSDFGISRIFDDELRQKLDITLTMPQDESAVRCLGSAFYLAPELQGETPEKATPASDAWALGVMMFRFLTGFWFERDNREKCLALLEGCDLPWQALIAQLCAEAPNERRRASGFVALSAMLRPQDGQASAPTPKRRSGLKLAASLIGLSSLAAVVMFSPMRWEGWLYGRQPSAVPLLSVSANFDDLKLLNDGKSVLWPGIAAGVKCLTLSWDETMLSNAVASVISSKTVGDSAIASLLLSAHCYNDEVNGIAIEVSDVTRLLEIMGGFNTSDELLPGVVPTNLTCASLHLVPFENFASTSNFCLLARFDYGTEALGENTKAGVSGIFESAGELLNWNVTNDQGEVVCFAMFKLQDKAEILKRILQYRKQQIEESCVRSQSWARDSDDTAVEIAPERRSAIKKAEAAYMRRQIYDPVVAALKAEPPETQAKWIGVLATADIMLRTFEDDAFSIYRKFAGRGAEIAYKNGCLYPVPISYAYASMYKRLKNIQTAFSNLYVNIEHDTRWNAASRMMFYGSMCIVSDALGKKVTNAPPSLTNVCNRALETATYDFLKEKNYTTDEIGMAFHMARYCSQHGVLSKAYARLKAEGERFDPWMDLMIQAQIAYTKAWDARGPGLAHTVTAEGWRIYNEEIRKVLPLLEKAYRLRPELSWNCSLALEAALGDSYARELWLKRLFACCPDYVYGLSCYLWGLRPRWGGTNQKMAEFLLGLVRKQQFDTMVPIFAYERIVKDVFASEGGVALKEGAFPNVDKFILAYRKDFEPYFAAYHQNGFEEKLPFIEKVHLYVALADLAWRLENEQELLYWSGKFEALMMPAHETEFDNGYKQYGPYLAALRKLEGARRHDFLVGLHALCMDGDPQAIDKMRAIADEIGEFQLAFECVLSRKGKVNLIPFLKGPKKTTTQAAKDLRIEFNGRQRDHMIFRVQLRAGEDISRTIFDMSVEHGIMERWREQGSHTVCIEGCRGRAAQNRKVDCAGVDWPRDRETCAFEFEIVGNQARLTQNGVCLLESRLTDIPSLCDVFYITGFFGIEVTVQKFEMEVLDTMDFVIQSVPKQPSLKRKE